MLCCLVPTDYSFRIFIAPESAANVAKMGSAAFVARMETIFKLVIVHSQASANTEILEKIL